MGRSHDNRKKVYVVTSSTRSLWGDETCRCEGVHANLEDAERHVWNLKLDYQRKLGYGTDSWEEFKDKDGAVALHHYVYADLRIDEQDFPHYVFVQGWTKDHRQILSDGSIQTVQEYVDYVDNSIRLSKESTKDEYCKERMPEIARVFEALGLPANHFVNDHLDIDDLPGVDEERVRAASEKLGLKIDLSASVCGVAKELKERDETFSEVNVGDYVRVFHPFGDGSYGTCGRVLARSNSQFLVHERALSDSYHIDLPKDANGHHDWISVPCWKPMENLGWFDPTDTSISKIHGEDIMIPDGPGPHKIVIARSGGKDWRNHVFTKDAIYRAADAKGYEVREASDGEVEMIATFSPEAVDKWRIEKAEEGY
jgi:hypothetical protein